MKRIIFIYCFVFLPVTCLYGQEIIEELLLEGIEYHDEGKYGKAIETYEKALQINPHSVEVIYELSLSLLKSEDYYGAIEYSDKLLDRDDKFAILAYNTKGSALNYLGKSEEAIDVYLEGIKKDSDFYLSYYNLGLAYYSNKEFENARDAFIACLDLDPKHTGSHLNLGRTMFVMNKRVESLLCLYYFLLLEPESDRSLWAYDTVLLQLNDTALEEGQTDPSDIFDGIDRKISQKALSVQEQPGNKNEVELFTDQTESFFFSFKDVDDDLDPEHDFWWSFYIPFFKSMASWGYTDVFCHYIRLSVHQIPEAWIDVNRSRIKGFNTWLRRQ